MIKSSILIIVFGWICFYFGLPTLNFGFYGLPFIILLSSGLLYIIEYQNRKNDRSNKINPIIKSVFLLTLSFIIFVPISGDCPGTVDLSATLNWDNVPDVSNASI